MCPTFGNYNYLLFTYMLHFHHVKCVQSSRRLVFYQCIFLNNKATNGNGGALYFDTCKEQITKCERGYGSGGAVYSFFPVLEIKSDPLSNNSSVYANVLYKTRTHQTILIVHSVIRQNQAQSSGGGVWLQGGELVMEWCNVLSNLATYYGGGAYLENVTSYISHGNVENNEVTYSVYTSYFGSGGDYLFTVAT